MGVWRGLGYFILAMYLNKDKNKKILGLVYAMRSNGPLPQVYLMPKSSEYSYEMQIN